MIENDTPISGVLLLERPPASLSAAVGANEPAPEVYSPPAPCADVEKKLQIGIADYGTVALAGMNDKRNVGTATPRVASDMQENLAAADEDYSQPFWEPVSVVAIQETVELDPAVIKKQRKEEIEGQLARLSKELEVLWDAGTKMLDPARVDLATRRAALEAELARIA